MSYDPEPRYPVVGGDVRVGYEALAADLAGRGPCVVAVDGPAALPWERFAASLAGALAAVGLRSRSVEMRRLLAPWKEVQARTASAELAGDPVFARSFEGSLAQLFDELPRVSPAPGDDVTLVVGPGSALVDHDVLWYADLPKRLSLEAVQSGLAGNLGQPPGETGSEQRLLFVDWPVLDRHKHALAARLDCYVDLSDAGSPRSVDGAALRSSLRALSAVPRPGRARPGRVPSRSGHAQRSSPAPGAVNGCGAPSGSPARRRTWPGRTN